jgi:hypothetical protein
MANHVGNCECCGQTKLLQEAAGYLELMVCESCNREIEADFKAEQRMREKEANHIDGYDRDDIHDYDNEEPYQRDFDRD